MSEIMSIAVSEKQPVTEVEIQNNYQTYPEFRRYIDSLTTSQSKKRYSRVITHYCKLCGLNPHELVNLGTTDEEKIRNASIKLQDFCDDWLRQKQQGIELAPLSEMISLIMSVRGFYKRNWLKLKEGVGDNVLLLAPSELGTYTPSKEEANEFREIMRGKRDKMMIHLVSCCPLRKEEVRNLNWKDIQDFDEDYPYILLPSKRLKGKGRYKGVWFFGVICKTLKKELVEWQNEQKRVCKKQKIQWSETMPIFTTWNRKMKIRGLEFWGLTAILRRATKDYKTKTQKRITLHDFRRYFRRQLNKARESGIPIPEDYDYWFLGHKLEGVNYAYSQIEANIPNMIRIFEELEPFIDIDLEEPKETKYQRLEREKADLLDKVKDLTKQISELNKRLSEKHDSP